MEEVVQELQEWLSKQIELYDRLTDSTEFMIDSQIYNENAHLLRRVKDELKNLIKLHLKGELKRNDSQG